MDLDILVCLQSAINSLKILKIINNQGDIARDLGYKREGTISEIVKGRVPLSDKFIKAFCTTYDINEEFLRKGGVYLFNKGTQNDKIAQNLMSQKTSLSDAFYKELMRAEMLISNSDSELEHDEILNSTRQKDDPELYNLYLRKKALKETQSWLGVPIYDTEVTAGMLSLIRDEAAPEPAYYLPIPGFKDCSFGARVSGDSMYPEIRNGDFVICKEVTDFIFGDIYLVITRDGQETVKYIHPNENPEFITLVPYNKSVPSTPIAKTSLIKVYKVKGVLKGY